MIQEYVSKKWLIYLKAGLKLVENELKNKEKEKNPN